ncbi:hypothetical protein D5086_027844 [Populus alba]|uniref:Uncharacterized protein n=1 Tax=Populus alba TaxID=43335 RepID=A0ACC4AWJ9_POPAL
MISLSLPSSPAKIPLPSPKPTNHPSRQKPPSSTTFKPQNSSFYSLKDRLFHHLNAGHLQKAISTLDQMSQQGTHPDLITYSLLLKSCIRSHNYQLGHLVHHRLTQSGLELDSVILNSLISLYSKCGDWQQAHEIFESMGNKRDLVSWSALISCYANNEKEFEAISAFFDMLECGFYPNEYCFTGVFRACSNKENISLGEIIFGFLLKTGYFESDVCVGCALIDMFVKGNGDLESAYKVFDRMPDRNVVTWTLMITRFQQLGFSRDAVGLFLDMVLSGYVPDRFTLSGVVSACAEMGLLSLGRQFHCLVMKSGLDLDVCVGCSLVDMYAKCVADGKAFDVLFEKNLVSYNTIVNAYAKSLNSEEAFELYTEIEGTGTGVDAFTFASLLSGASSIGAIGKGEQIHARILKSGFKSNLHICNALISMYSRCGNIEAAFQVFNEMGDGNVISWTSMITGFAKHGFATRALETFHKMLEAGRLEEAMELVNSMPFKADALVLRTFLGACRVHGNMDLGKHAAEMILEQDPNDPAAYILLSNLHASADKQSL